MQPERETAIPLYNAIPVSFRKEVYFRQKRSDSDEVQTLPERSET